MNPSISSAAQSPAASKPALPQQAIDGKLQSSAGNASSRAQERASANSAVAMVAQQQADIQAAEQPLSLLARTLTQGLNESLEASLGPQPVALGFAEEPGPEELASQFSEVIGGLFEQFGASQTAQDSATPMADFLALLRSGLEQGFAEARGTLDGLQALSEQTAQSLDDAEALIAEALAAFEASFSAEAAAGDTQDPTAS